MGLFLRKSISLGPIRFNLSKSGVGMSVGVTGLRYGIRPSGREYVHAGRYGVYFRQELTRKPRSRPQAHASTHPIQPTQHFAPASASALAKASGSQIVELLRHVRRRRRIDVIAGVLLAPICAAVFALNVTFGIIASCLALAFIAFCVRWEKRRRAIYLHFTSDNDAPNLLRHVISAVNAIAACSQIWCKTSATSITTLMGFKHNAGASELIDRRSARVGEGTPRWIESDLPIPAIRASAQTLYFLPDGILVDDPSGIAHVEYEDLDISTQRIQFIESTPPHDATIVDYTWRHPNKDGGPDRRFSSNYQIPVCEYGEVILESPRGLLVYLQTSRSNGGERFADAMTSARSAMATTYASPGAADPWIEVNPEFFQSFGEATRSQLKDARHSLIELVRTTDGLIAKSVGQHNKIVHLFCRFLAVEAALCLLVAAGYLLLAMA